MNRALVWVLAIAMLLAAPLACPAQKDFKQFVTISFSGYDDLMKGIGWIGKLGGMPELPQMIELQLQAAGGAALQTLEKSQPWVATVKTDDEGNQFAVQAFIPIKDVKKVLESLPLPIPGGPADAGDGVLELRNPGGSLFVKQHGNWAVVSNEKRWVVEAPDDPVQATGGMHQKYHLAVQLSVKSIPEALRTKFLGLLSLAMQAGLRQMPGESDEQFAARTKMVQHGMEQMKTLLGDMDALTLGIKVDDVASTAYLEYTFTVLPGSKTAKKLARTSDTKTNLAGLVVPGAAVVFQGAQNLDPEDVEQMKANLAMLRSNALSELEKQGLSDEQLKQAKQLAGDLMEVLEKTLEAGKLDLAASAKLEPTALTVVAGAQIAEGAKLESTLKQLIQQVVKDEPEVAKFIKLDAEEHAGVRFHVLSIPTQGMDDAEKVAALVGQSFDVVLGISDSALYVSLGRDALPALKLAIDRSKSDAGKAVPPLQFSVAAGAIARFVAAVGEDRAKPGAMMMAKMFEASEGKDHVKLTATAIPNGVRMRVEAEEGVLKLAALAPALAGAKMKALPPATVKPRAPKKPAKTSK